MKNYRVLGCDPSLRNWGMALGTYSPSQGELVIASLHSVHPVLPTGKQVRQNSLDLESAHQLFLATERLARQADMIFVEVPVGSQSARAMASYGICVGVLGALRNCGMPFFEVTPTEVKLASVGSKTATKKEMIDWAVQKHPEANWPRYMHNGSAVISEAKAEHMADAVAAIYAGMDSQAFLQLMRFRAA